MIILPQSNSTLGRIRLWLVCALALLIPIGPWGCLVPGTDPTGTTAAPIVNGTLDKGHPTVGIIFSGDLRSACTGTLIAKDKVLTAAHCLLSEKKPRTWRQKIYFFLGDGPDRIHYAARAVAARSDYDGPRDHDIALLWLHRSIQGITPSPLSTTAVAKGDSLTIVGYGVTGATAGDFGKKRVAQQEIDEIDPWWLAFDSKGGKEPGTCGGDSGGPSFMSRGGIEEVVGVHSASTIGCEDWHYDMRVDAYASWLQTEKPEVSMYRAACGDNSDCISGLCAAGRDGKRYCSEPCAVDKPCRYADACESADGKMICVPHTGGNSALGDACQSGLDCDYGVCVVLDSGNGICTRNCTLSGTECPAGYGCLQSSRGFVCAPKQVVVDEQGVATQDAGVGEASAPTPDGGQAMADASPTDSRQSTDAALEPASDGGCRVTARSGKNWPLLALFLLLLGFRGRRDN